MEFIVTLVIFLITYAIIVSEKINRSVIVMVGGLLIVALGILSWDKAIKEYIDWNTIFLLIGMMITVSIAGRSGMFEYVGVKLAKVCKGKPLAIAMAWGVLTAFVSMFLDNVTAILLLAPITLSITHKLKISPYPFLLIQVFLSNIGGTATIVGDPPNIMISQQVGFGFVEFAKVMLPLVLIIIVVSLVICRIMFKKNLSVFTQEAIDEVMKMDEKEFIKDRKLMNISIVVIIVLIAGFIFGEHIGISPALLSILTAFTMLLFASLKSEEIIEAAYTSVDWTSIFFFMGLFILTGALEEVGVLKIIVTFIIDITNGDLTKAYTAIMWFSAVLSGFIDNIPFVSTMIPVLKDVVPEYGANADVLWYALAAGACLGGNLTILGASANVIAVGIAKKDGIQISYLDFLKKGFFITIFSIVISYIYLYIYFLL
ncbi:MAG: ArsB/NhaD family transporter [Erysipelotrichales bacterium]